MHSAPPDLSRSTAALPSVCADLIILLGDSTLRHMHGHKLGVSPWFRATVAAATVSGKAAPLQTKWRMVEPAAVYFAPSRPRFLCKPKLFAFILAAPLEKHRCAYDAGM